MWRKLTCQYVPLDNTRAGCYTIDTDLGGDIRKGYLMNVEKLAGDVRISSVLLATALALLLCPFPLRAGDSLEQLQVNSGDGLAVPAPSADKAMWPTGMHDSFAGISNSNYKASDPYGDYYPFVKESVGMALDNKLTDPIYGDTPGLGLLGGMGSEIGHPSLFANGGNPKYFWELALKSFRHGYFAAAYSCVGVMAHLTQDQAIPVHAANINHVITLGDKFEGRAKKNIAMLEKVSPDAENITLPEMLPYEYYQVLQDDTRRHLELWVNPETNKPYWEAAPDAPPLGQDATKGPWSHYSDKKDTYNIALSPEIMQRQMLMAAVYTREVVRAAAKLMPPAIGHLKAVRSSKRDTKSAVNVSFDVHDNRRGQVKVTIERPLYGKSESAAVEMKSSRSDVPVGRFAMQYAALASEAGGKDVVVVTAQDGDGNVTREEVEVSRR